MKIMVYFQSSKKDCLIKLHNAELYKFELVQLSSI